MRHLEFGDQHSVLSLVIFLVEGEWIAHVAALFIWPALATATLLFIAAFRRKSKGMAGIACFLCAPTFLYITGYPDLRFISPISFFLLCLGAWRIADISRRYFALLALPAASIVAFLAYTVVASKMAMQGMINAPYPF